MYPSWQLAVDALSGRPGRSVLIVSAVMLAASLVVAVSCAIASAHASLELGIIRFLGATDARIIHQFNGRFGDDVLESVRSWPEVKQATGRLLASMTLIHADRRRDPDTDQVLRITPEAIGVDFELLPQFKVVELIDGSMPAAPHEILVDPMTAEHLHADVGDVLEVQRFGQPITLLVAAIFDRPGLGVLQRPSIQMDRQTLAEIAYRPGQLTSILILLKDGEDVEAFCDRHLDELPETLAVEPAEKIRAGFDRQIIASQLAFIIGSMLVFL